MQDSIIVFGAAVPTWVVLALATYGTLSLFLMVLRTASVVIVRIRLRRVLRDAGLLGLAISPLGSRVLRYSRFRE